MPSFISESRVLNSLTIIGLGLICGFTCLHVCFMKLSVPVLERISNETWTSGIRLLVVSSIVFSVLWARICEVDSWLDDLRETEVSRQLAREGGSVPCQCGKSAGKLPVPSPLCTSSIPKVFFFFWCCLQSLRSSFL